MANQYRQHRNAFGKALSTGQIDLSCDWPAFRQAHHDLDIFACLRRYRQSRLAMLGALDVLAGADWPEHHRHTLSQVSQLADILIHTAWEASQQFVRERFGLVSNHDGTTTCLHICALGKLGGQELNFSSDVDLVLFHTASHTTGTCSDGQRSLDAHSYFERQARYLVRLLDQVTTDGRVYRVDTRLRPFGSAAPLVCSLDALLGYLETEGREWERLAWLRARLVAGDLPPESVLATLKPFVYRRHLDFAVFDHLRDIKAQIIQQQQSDRDNLKLGTGGIREVEFIVQALQLAFGGRDAQLQGNDLWHALHQLGDKGLLQTQEIQQLARSWLFLRRLENLCQLIDDQQTHHVPVEKTKRQQLAIAFGYHTDKALSDALTHHRHQVHAIFQRLFADPNTRHQPGQAAASVLPEAWRQRVQTTHLPQAHKDRINAILQQSGVIGTPVGESLLNVLLAIGRRESYLIMLHRNAPLVEKLVQQLSYPALAQRLQSHPFLLETLFDSEPPANETHEFRQRWRDFYQRHRPDDEETRMELARQFKHLQEYRIIQSYASGAASSTVTSQRLANLAACLVSIACHQAYRETCLRHAGIQIPESALMLLAYGSLASGYMHPGSDLDLVMLVDDRVADMAQPQTARFLHRWVRRLVHWLTANTYHGHLYHLDTRLRPNGNAGLALVSLSGFRRYQLEQAWTWEHLALIKSRLICAEKKQIQHFEQIRHDILTRPHSHKHSQEINDMRHRMQQHGINAHHAEDFDLLTCVLNHAPEHPAIIVPRSEPDIITALQARQLITAETAGRWLARHHQRIQARLQAPVESQ